MDAAILLRIAPALAVATVVAWAAARDRGVPAGRVVDEVLRATLVGLVAARLWWILAGGPLVWRRALTTVMLVRAGVETVVGVLVALVWVVWRSDDDERVWLLVAAPASALAGVAVWQASCGVEDVCAGIPVGWGVRLAGYASRVAPVGYLEAAVAAGLALVAFTARRRPAVAVGAAAGYALARAGLGFLRAPLAGVPSTDQWWSLLLAVVLAVVAVRLRGRELPTPAVAA